MTLKEIAALSNARVIHENGHLDKVIRHAFAAGRMGLYPSRAGGYQ